MISDDIATLAGLLASFGAGFVVAGAIAFFWGKYFFSSYLSEKAKNLATREDIEEITNKIEAVRIQYTSLSEELKARHQLRLAALDKRLAAHQEAFSLWRELLAKAHSDDIGTTVLKCQNWWENNCIYLEATVREHFVRAYTAAGSHNSLTRGRADPKLVMDNWKEIMEFPNQLFVSIQLPALSELETKHIQVDIDHPNRKVEKSE